MGKCLFMRKGETHTAPISGILASDLAVGSSVYLMENGVSTEYLVVNQGKPSGSSLYDDSCNGTWLLRKYVQYTRQWNSSAVNDYKNSTIHTWLNEDFFNQLGSVEKESIKQVKIPYVNGTGSSAIASGVKGLSAKIFLLAVCELGLTNSDNSWIPTDGAKLNYFESGFTDSAKNKRLAYLKGTSTVRTWWLRSPYTFGTDKPWFQDTDGSLGSHLTCDEAIYVRPALVLPLTAVFDETTMLLKGVA